MRNNQLPFAEKKESSTISSLPPPCQRFTRLFYNILLYSLLCYLFFFYYFRNWCVYVALSPAKSILVTTWYNIHWGHRLPESMLVYRLCEFGKMAEFRMKPRRTFLSFQCTRPSCTIEKVDLDYCAYSIDICTLPAWFCISYPYWTFIKFYCSTPLWPLSNLW